MRVELREKDIRTLRQVDNHPAIKTIIYGIVLEAQVALERAETFRDVGEILIETEQRILEVFEEHPQIKVPHPSKIQEIVLGLCTRTKQLLKRAI